MAKPLRHGYTTGACAAAATLGAALMLREQRSVEMVELPLPAGFSASFTLQGQRFCRQSAGCFVVKDAGDDPDVTHGVEVHATVALVEGDSPGVRIEGGVGIGRVTKPGLAVAVSEWAINPVPRRMIQAAIDSVFPQLPAGHQLRVTISIPDGAERSRRTLNERLGILGGLSILGTSGVVRPISHKAWTDTLEVALDVALAAGSSTVVLATGRSSERVAQQQLALAEETFIMMGDHVGYAFEACHRRGFSRIVLAAQFAKLVKIACGHSQTHVHSSSMDLQQLAVWGRRLGLDDIASKQIECANTAREVFLSHPDAALLIAEVVRQALQQLERRAPGAQLEILLVDYAGAPAGHFVKGSGA
ncbi:MAG: cobalt-precorrin-5B (C(1))-methyltransferase CbiD [Trichloromonadaceae bacterium]